MTTTTRFDALLDRVDNLIMTGGDSSDGRCFCRQHYHSPTGARREYNGWDGEVALVNLGLHWLPKEDICLRGLGSFELWLNGILAGYTDSRRGIWLDPFNDDGVLHTIIHEMAHQMNDHTHGRAHYNKSQMEYEAELTALLVLDALDVPDAFGVTMHYLRSVGRPPHSIPMAVRERLKASAMKILDAGRVAQAVAA